MALACLLVHAGRQIVFDLVALDDELAAPITPAESIGTADPRWTMPRPREVATAQQHLTPALGHMRIGELDVEDVERYVAALLGKGYAPATVNRHLNVIYAVLKAARRRRLIRENVVELIERPPEPRRRWQILTPAELARNEAAFRQLASEEEDPAERIWIEQARCVFLVVAGLGLRRGELLGLRWRNVRCTLLKELRGEPQTERERSLRCLRFRCVGSATQVRRQLWPELWPAPADLGAPNSTSHHVTRRSPPL